VRCVAKPGAISCRIYCLDRKLSASAFMPYSLCGTFDFLFSVLCCDLSYCVVSALAPYANGSVFELFLLFLRRLRRKFVANYG